MLDSSAQPFFDAIRAAPDDDAPRLIYADWLEERADPASRDLAAFIRAQCHVSSALHCGTPQPQSADELAAVKRAQATAEKLQRKHKTAWMKPLADLELLGADFERGLISWAATTALHFPETAPALIARCPGLRLVTVQLQMRIFAQGVLDHMLASPAIPLLPGLQIVGPIGDRGAERLAAADFAALTRLDLSQNEIGDAGAIALADSTRFPKLRRLDFTRNAITEAGFEALTRRAAVPPGMQISLAGNHIRPASSRDVGPQ